MDIYDELIKDNYISINDNDIEKFITEIAKLSKSDQELCFAIIKKYYIENEHDPFNSSYLPYNAKQLKKGIRFNFIEFPIKLQQILIKLKNSLFVN